MSDKTLYGNKESYKYFSGNKSNYVIIDIWLPQMSRYVKSFDETKVMCFITKENKPIEA